MNTFQENCLYFHKPNYNKDCTCPTCNGSPNHFSGCQKFQSDNRNDRGEAGWRISYSSPHRLSHVIQARSHVPTSPPIIEFYPLGIVQPLSQTSYASQIEQPQTHLISPPSLDQKERLIETKVSTTTTIRPEKEEEKTLQIRVASLNKGHLVWISIEPRETGKSIASKIYKIAGFRTRKVESVYTGSGRQLVLDKRKFVFSTWDHIEQFKHGEIWKIEWEPVKRNMFEKVLDKIIKT